MEKERRKNKIGNIARRLLAGSIDIILIVFCTYFIAQFAINIISSSDATVVAKKEEKYNILKETKLVKYDDETKGYRTYKSSEYFVLSDGNYQCPMIDVFSYYYVDYLKEYNQSTLAKAIFQVDKYDFFLVDSSNNVSFNFAKYKNDKNEINSSAVSFIMSKYQDAIDRYYKIPEIVEIDNFLNEYTKRIYFIIEEIMVFVFIIAVPLIKLSGLTLGKRLIHLKVSSRGEKKLNTLNIILRGLIFFTIPVYLFFTNEMIAFIYPVVLAVASIICMYLSNDELSISDYIGYTSIKSNDTNE